jgi:hypothetical protein
MTYPGVKRLQRYVDEFGYRFSRKAPELLARMAKVGGMPYSKLVE